MRDIRIEFEEAKFDRMTMKVYQGDELIEEHTERFEEDEWNWISNLVVRMYGLGLQEGLNEEVKKRLEEKQK